MSLEADLKAAMHYRVQSPNQRCPNCVHCTKVEKASHIDGPVESVDFMCAANRAKSLFVSEWGVCDIFSSRKPRQPKEPQLALADQSEPPEPPALPEEGESHA